MPLIEQIEHFLAYWTPAVAFLLVVAAVAYAFNPSSTSGE